MKIKLPKFQRLNVHTFKRVKNVWRKPRGIDSKQRQKLKAYGAYPDVGYRTPRNERHLVGGMVVILVANEKDLAKAAKEDPKKNVVRFSGTLGKKKRLVLDKKAKEWKLKVLN